MRASHMNVLKALFKSTLRRRRRLATTSLLTAVLITGTATSATADYADYGPGGMGFKGTSSSPLNLQPVNVDSYWFGVIDEGARRWNQSTAVSNMRRISGTSGGKVYADYYVWNGYGLYTSVGEKCVNRTFKIEINARTIVRDYPPSYHDTQNKGVMMHEMGHILSLGDNPTNPSVMGGTANLPTPYDTERVRNYNRDLPCQKGQWSFS